MFRSIEIVPLFLSIVVIVSIVLCKYFNSPIIFMLVLVLISIIYQIDANKKNNKNYDFTETLISLSKFIIITGISGYIVTKIVGLFYPVLNK